MLKSRYSNQILLTQSTEGVALQHSEVEAGKTEKVKTICAVPSLNVTKFNEQTTHSAGLLWLSNVWMWSLTCSYDR